MTVKWLVVVSFEAIVRLVTPRVFSAEEDILFVKYKWALLSLSFFFQGFPETVQILLECGAHINWQQPAGETALMRVSSHRI